MNRRATGIPTWAGWLARERSLLLVENHERPVAEVGVNARWAAPAGPTTLRLARLHALPPLVPSSVQDDLDLLIFGEILPQMTPEVRLVPGDNEQASNRAAHGTDSVPPPGSCQGGVYRGFRGLAGRPELPEGIGHGHTLARLAISGVQIKAARGRARTLAHLVADGLGAHGDQGEREKLGHAEKSCSGGAEAMRGVSTKAGGRGHRLL